MDTISPEAVGMSAAHLDEVNGYLQRYLTAYQVPGVVTLVARRGKVIHLGGAGALSLETGQLVQTDTIFRIYSMTKPITCVALLMLVEAGRMRLDDPVARYLPAFADLQVLIQRSATETAYVALERPITIHDLLTHTAGMGYGLFQDSPVEDHYRACKLLSRVLTLRRPLADLIAQVVQMPLAAQPGHVWRYSVAHDVIAHLVATVADMPFEAFLATHIFGPLGMSDTGFHVPEAQQSRFASLYLRSETGDMRLLDEPATSLYVHPGAEPAGGGGLVSTLSDYWRFAQMLLNQGTLGDVRLLRRKTVALMTRNHLPTTALPFRIGPGWVWNGYGYGYGVAMVLNPAQTALPGSAGTFEWAGAANTSFWVDPHEELIGILMTQLLPAPTHPRLDHAFKRLVYEAIID
jgi:CubicO group peptidase (beta-lactamase class C family)